MDFKFIESFLNVAREVEKLGRHISWPIPTDANASVGDFGLLPEDTFIEAWQVPSQTAGFLRFQVLVTKAKLILELGSSIGYSTLWLGEAAKETDGHVYTTEIFSEKADLAERHIKKGGLQDRVTLLRQTIHDVLNNWNHGPIDFVFMDADKQQYSSYMRSLDGLMSDRGMIVVDNVGNYPQYMKDFIAACKETKRYSGYFLSIDNGLLLLQRNGGYNLLAHEKNPPFDIDA